MKLTITTARMFDVDTETVEFDNVDVVIFASGELRVLRADVIGIVQIFEPHEWLSIEKEES